MDLASTDKGNQLMLNCQEKLLSVEGTEPVPRTDTGGQGEHPKVCEANHVKELGKMTP